MPALSHLIQITNCLHQLCELTELFVQQPNQSTEDGNLQPMGDFLATRQGYMDEVDALLAQIAQESSREQLTIMQLITLYQTLPEAEQYTSSLNNLKINLENLEKDVNKILNAHYNDIKSKLKKLRESSTVLTYGQSYQTGRLDSGTRYNRLR